MAPSARASSGKSSARQVPGRHWRRQFLETLATTSNVTAAAQVAKVSLPRAYQTRRDDPDFARAWQAAVADGYLNLELEVIRRLREGDLKTANGDKFDFANAIRLIAAQRGKDGRPQSEVRNVSIAEVRASIERKIEEAERQVARAKARRGNA
jgi:hypothetical protein